MIRRLLGRREPEVLPRSAPMFSRVLQARNRVRQRLGTLLSVLFLFALTLAIFDFRMAKPNASDEQQAAAAVANPSGSRQSDPEQPALQTAPAVGALANESAAGTRAGGIDSTTAPQGTTQVVPVATSGGGAGPQAASATDASAAAAGIAAALDAWASAWSRQDLDAYFAAYVPGYRGRAASGEEWRQERGERIRTRKWIRVRLSNVKTSVSDDRAEANFDQYYQSDARESRSRKRVQLERQGTRWLISSESDR